MIKTLLPILMGAILLGCTSYTQTDHLQGISVIAPAGEQVRLQAAPGWSFNDYAYTRTALINPGSSASVQDVEHQGTINTIEYVGRVGDLYKFKITRHGAQRQSTQWFSLPAYGQ